MPTMRMPASTFSEMRRLSALRDESLKLRERIGYDSRVKARQLDAEFLEGATELWPILMGYAHAWLDRNSCAP